MDDLDDLLRLLQRKGATAAQLHALREKLAPIVVHRNTGVVAGRISGPVAVGQGASATIRSASNRAKKKPTEGPNIEGRDKEPPPNSKKDEFMAQANQIAKTASSAVGAISSIMNLVSKFV